MIEYLTPYDYIRLQESAYQKPIELEDGWFWSMRDHLRRSFLYKNSQFLDNNEDRYLRPNKNIILAIRNLENRLEGFDVKDIEIYVDDKDEYYQSALVKKYHDKWAKDNFIDTVIDDCVDSYGDYGGALVRNTGTARPEVIDLKSLAFCNQRNILAFPFCVRHKLSQSELKEYEEKSGWGDSSNGATISVDDLIVLCKDEEEIEIFELHGTLPGNWLENGSKKFTQQIQVIAYYLDQNKQEQGVCLFKKREPKLPFKFLARDKIANRALGRGGIEEKFESQKWTNWNEIKVCELLEAVSKVIRWTDDPTIAAKHPTGLKNMDNNEIIELTAGRQMGILQNPTGNVSVFNDALERWERHIQTLSAASDSLLGESPSSGTPFKLYEAKIMEDKGMHRFRQGQIAVFWDEIYRDWILPHLSKEISNDQQFLAEFSADEMEKIADNVAKKEWNKYVLKGVLKENIDFENKDAFIANKKQEFLKGGLKRFVEFFKGEIKKPLAVMTNIAGKQKNLALLTDKLVNVLRQYISTPAIRQDPEMNKILNTILESSGLSPIMFGAGQQPATPQQGNGEIMKDLTRINQPATV